MRAAAFICLIALAVCQGARAAEPEKNAGAEVATEFFSVLLPPGWMQPLPIKEQKGGAISAAFVGPRGEPAVAINVIPAPLNGKQLAEMMARDMEKNGMRAGPLTQRGKLWHMEIEGRTKGAAWFGSNGRICAATMIFGANPDLANELFASLRSEQRDIFPEKAD